MSKQIMFGQKAMNEIMEGINIFANTVGVTLGPKGRCVIYDKEQAVPTITKDGVTVAKEVELEGFQELGCSLIREVSSKTSDTVGDGTTTAIIIAQKMMLEGQKLVAAGHNPLTIKQGMDRAVSSVVAHLESHKKHITEPSEIAEIATISSNGDKTIGDIIAEAIDQIGQDGVITVEESQTIDTYLKIIEGVKINQGYLSHQFLTDDIDIKLQNPYVLVTDKRIQSLREIESILNEIGETDRPLFVFCEDMVSEALQTLIFNNNNGTLLSCAVKAPSVGEKRSSIIEDVAILTGATFVTEKTGISLSELFNFGW